MWLNRVFFGIIQTFSLCGSKNISQTRFHILGEWKPFQSLCFCGVADLTSSSEVHPEHLHPNCSCVNSKAHATGSCDTHIWYHYNEIMWVTGFLHYVVLAVSWPSDSYTFISVGTLRNCFVKLSSFMEMLIIILFIVISYCLDVFFHWFKLGLF